MSFRISSTLAAEIDFYAWQLSLLLIRFCLENGPKVTLKRLSSIE